MQKHEPWLLIAQEDLDSAKYLFLVPFTTGLFHIQQSAEKALKAYIILKKGMVIKTHDLVRLIDICMEFDKDFESLRLFAAVLTPYEVAGRYPETSFIKPTIEEIQDLVAQAEFICNFVVHRIS
jgi:HEPN domain-containing protein